jgi:ABC-type multidrug transport system ATPase subunit
MNESILKALMQLFALVADVNKNGYSGKERDILMDYLDRQYSHEVVLKFIEYFEKKLKIYHPDILSAEEQEKEQLKVKTEVSIATLCNHINEEIEQEQKIIVLIYLLDFINKGEGISDNQIKIVTDIAGYLKINEEEFLDTKAFTFNELDSIRNKGRLLFIDSKDSSGDPEIKHMPNEKMDGQIVVLHLSSTNTYIFRYYGNLVLFLNGHNIKTNRSYVWSVGSVIKNQKIGSLYFSRVAGKFIQASVENKFVFTAEGIQYFYRNSNNGVKFFNLTEDSGRLIGIIGGSGSGKSTLLNVLNGNLKPQIGSIKINGFDIHEYKEELKGVIGYVPQDDMLIKELTVFQNLYYNAKLCFNEYSEEKIIQIVETAIKDFDLVEARDLSVGDAMNTILSGGQRKRLNIALELIREPSILFVDEPSSGLSSADSEKVFNLLKRQALKGKLVITNIHQPSSDLYKMLDKLLVMDQGGRIIYYGNPVSAITYFKKAAQFADADESECLSCGNINADQILRIVEARVVDSNGRLTRKRKTSPEEWYQKYLSEIDVHVRQTKREHEDSVPLNNFRIPNHARQFKIFLQRDVLAKFYNKQYLFINALEAPLLAVILAFFTKNFIFVDGKPTYLFGENPNLPAFLFMAVIVALFMGLVISAEEIFKDRILLKREKFLNLSRSSYLFSKITVLFIISAIQTLVFVLISNYMLQIHGMWIYYWMILFTASCWANLMGLIISSGLNSVVTIYILVPIILVPQLLMSGVIVEFDKMHNKIASSKNVPLIGDMMTSRWAYEALMVSQFKYNRFEKKFYEVDQTVHNTIFYKSFCIPELRRLKQECDKLNRTGQDSLKIIDDLVVIKNELGKMALNLQINQPKFVDNLNIHTYGKGLADSVINYIDILEKHYIIQYNWAILKKETIYDGLIDKFGSEKAFYDYKMRYYNKQLADVVRNNKEVTEYNTYDGELVRTKDAVFREPENNHGRAHFYAPIKKVSSVVIGTFWFNLMVLWLYSGVMFVLLYFDVLRKIISYFEILRLNRRNRLRLLRLIKVAEQESIRKALIPK